jgi:hypothetical protein
VHYVILILCGHKTLFKRSVLWCHEQLETFTISQSMIIQARSNTSKVPGKSAVGQGDLLVTHGVARVSWPRCDVGRELACAVARCSDFIDSVKNVELGGHAMPWCTSCVSSVR